MFCKICTCPGMVRGMSNFKLMSRTEKSIIKIEMDDVAVYGNTVVSSTEDGDMG